MYSMRQRPAEATAYVGGRPSLDTSRTRRTGATMIARCTPSERIRSASVLMCFMPTFTSSGKNTNICTAPAQGLTGILRPRAPT